MVILACLAPLDEYLAHPFGAMQVDDLAGPLSICDQTIVCISAFPLSDAIILLCGFLLVQLMQNTYSEIRSHYHSCLRSLQGAWQVCFFLHCFRCYLLLLCYTGRLLP
jgi:hypothetical protein